MVARMVAGLVALGLSVVPMTAEAQTDGWSPILHPDTFGSGVAACWAEGENSACLMLLCRDGGPFEIGLMAYGGNFRLEPMLPVFIRVDGGPVFALRMTPLDVFNREQAAVPYDPAQHGALVQALRTGQTATVAVYEPSSNPRAYPLGNRPGAVDGAMSDCGAPALAAGAGGQATPAMDPARFVQVDPALRDPQATALARALLADTLAAEPGTDVSASIAVLPDGRQILVAEHGVSTNSYGITGVGTYVFTADPGGPFRMAYRTTGVVVWLDAAQLSEGFPDLWVRNMRGIDPPYGIWRHIGGQYRHQRNQP